jgi:tRNA threonylcarbamoyladenosine biosynthesis protein TsaB
VPDECALAIEASTDQLSLAMCRGGKSAHWAIRPARDETQRVYEHAARLLAKSGASLRDLDFVAFGCGPGSFTGVRVAASAAQGIAYALSIPVCRISSLAVLAAGAARTMGAKMIATCLDARMERVYVALYDLTESGIPHAVMRDQLIRPDDIQLPGHEPFTAVGDGWRAYPAALEPHGSRVLALDAGLLPSARDLLSIAIDEFHSGRTVGPQEALPEYLGQAPSARP